MRHARKCFTLIGNQYSMEKSNRIAAQVYGYAVCLVAIIGLLLTITTLVNAVLDLGNPMHAGFSPAGSPSLVSFENYTLDVVRSFQQTDGKTAYLPNDAALQKMYEAARKEKVMKVEHDANKSILISSLIIGLCLILFFTHWRWLNRMARKTT